jgi:hypothetical protein
MVFEYKLITGKLVPEEIHVDLLWWYHADQDTGVALYSNIII